MNRGVNDAPRAVCAAEGAVRDERLAVPAWDRGRLPAVATNAVELTPRGLELLETLNELFDALASGNEKATIEQP